MRGFVLGIMFAVLPAKTVAQAPQVAPAATPPQVWQLDWQKNHCTISTGDPKAVGLAMWMTPGDPQPDIYLIGSPAVLPNLKGNTLKITLLPSKRSFSTKADNLSDASSVHAMAGYAFSEELPAAFAASTEVRIDGLGTPVSIPVIGAGKAMAALREQCIDPKLSEWGLTQRSMTRCGCRRLIFRAAFGGPRTIIRPRHRLWARRETRSRVSTSTRQEG